MTSRFLPLTGCLLTGLMTVLSPADAAAQPKPRTFARLIIQDHASQTVKWADVLATPSGELALSNPATVEGFPKLDAAKQKLVQMGRVQDKVLVGVRDEEDGQFGNGWVMIGAGARYTDHGDHGHWSFRKAPFVIGSCIDKAQGNPAHLYVYDGKFYLANDQKNGYTRFDPEDFPRAADPQAGSRPQFIPGGGNHITLAVVADKVGYGTWIDGDGPNKGRIDVTPILAGGTATIAYSFHTPTGALHGATASAGKVFFAPADGICWTEADLNARLKPDQVRVGHIPLGKDGEKPLRVGAFATHGNQVLAVTGKGDGAKLIVLDASAAEPKPTFLALHGPAGHKPLTPEITTIGGKNPMALVFHDHDKGTDSADRLDVIALDPNGDGKFDDAKLVKSLPVGPSAVDGHYGHHGLALDSSGELAFVTNPGDGTIQVVDLTKLEVIAKFSVGGTPTAVLALGGREVDD